MAGGTNTLISGPSRLTGLTLVGQTVGQVRTAYGKVLNIPEGAAASINGVADTQRIVNGEEVVFAKALGQKG